MKNSTLAFLITAILATGHAYATPSTTSVDRKLTSTTWLKNGVPVIARETPGSDIAHLEVRFLTGTAQQTSDRRVINLLAFESMPYATKKYSKQKIFEMTEKYAFGVSCSGGIEVSACKVETIQEFLPEAINLLLSVITEPLFAPEDVNLAKKQRIADFQKDLQSPESRANSVVNTIFYDASHPYRLLPEDGIKQTESLTNEALRSYHAATLDASSMFVTYAGPKMNRKTIAALNDKLGKLGKIQRQVKPIPAPEFDPKNTLAFEHRAIPTAYIRMKFNAPSATSPDATIADVLFEILSEKLHEEVRTKKSLSYSVHAGTIQYQQGIGMIAATTSKPRETLATIAAVIRNLKENGVSQEELNEYRNVFTTSYYLTMETQDQLAGALSNYQAYFGDANRLYDLPAKIEAVTPADIKRVAGEVLKNFRVGIVYDKDKFMNDWVAPLRSL